MITLEQLGWSPFFQRYWDSEDRAQREPARVVEQQRETCRVAAACGVLAGKVAGGFRHRITERAGFPAVGDWVSVNARPGEGQATVYGVLPRRTKFSRKAAGEATVEQVVAANIDTVFLVSSLNADLNPRRIERYLATIREGGAQPVILLNKADLCDNRAALIEEVSAVAAGVPIHAISAWTSEGMHHIEQYLQTGITVALLGSSGVGKSTIVNLLLGGSVQAVREIRADDDRGRHTTSSRKLFVLPGGGVLIDTPGLRELQLWETEAGLEDVFHDVEALAESCRFRNCQHRSEPRCAVREALDSGELDPARFESYLKLKKELLFLSRKQDIAARIEDNKKMKVLSRALKQHYKFKG